MAYLPNEFYHICNQGNNQQQIFYTEENYRFFLSKIRTHLQPVCEIIAWCLMPNHFHFLVYTTPESVLKCKVGSLELTRLSNANRIIMSSYAQALNIQQGKSGALFRPKTKSKFIDYHQNNYLQNTFDYIHQNPLEAGLVTNLSQWKYSSYPDYYLGRNGSLCNQEFASKFVTT